MAKEPITFVVDQRPLYLIILSRTSRLLCLLFIAYLFYLFNRAEPWVGLSVPGYRAIGAFFVCVILWVTQLLPMAITGLLAIVIVPLMGILSSKEAFSYFGNEAVFFILGAFILSAAILKTGLSNRMALLFLKGGSGSPQKLIWRILISTAFLSCIMPEHAVAAFFFPMILEMTRSLQFQPYGGSYGKTLFIAMAWGCIVGGIVTFLGGARAPLAMGILQEITGKQVGFFEWMRTTLPLACVLLVLAYGLIRFFFKIDVDSVSLISEALEQRRKKQGLMQWREKWVLLILVLAISGWMFLRKYWGLADIAIGSVVALFIFKVVTWQDVERYVNWGIILMYGGAICLGKAVVSSGAMEWLTHRILHYPERMAAFFGGLLGMEISPIIILFTIIAVFSLILSEMISNAAVVAIVLPLAIGLAQGYGIDPTFMAYVVAIPAGLGAVLPMSTPPMAIAYSSGYFTVKDLFLPGIVMDIVAMICFVLIMKFLWPLFGLVYSV